MPPRKRKSSAASTDEPAAADSSTKLARTADADDIKTDDSAAAASAPIASSSSAPAVNASGQVDIVISFDTTGSMASCIGEVRRSVRDLIERLFRELSGIRIGVVLHGDYDHGPHLEHHIDLTDDVNAITTFITTTADSGGGRTTPEAYEYVLREVQKLRWRPAAAHALLMIGDSYPHEPNDNPHKLDWRTECDELKALSIPVYSVQCLYSGRGAPFQFWKAIAERTNGYHLFLDQFSFVRDMIIAICLQQHGDDAVTGFEQELTRKAGGTLTISARRMFDTILKRSTGLSSAPGADDYDTTGSGTQLKPCPPAKYQIIKVDAEESIKDFVNNRGLTFKSGKGFYQFTKPEQISAKKLIVLQKKTTGELFEGAAARKIAGITSANEAKKVAPSDIPEYHAFIQSTSSNRKLVAGSFFLYEAEDYIPQ